MAARVAGTLWLPFPASLCNLGEASGMQGCKMEAALERRFFTCVCLFHYLSVSVFIYAIICLTPTQTQTQTQTQTDERRRKAASGGRASPPRGPARADGDAEEHFNRLHAPDS